ncbi:MAG: hypothetical protein H0T51_13320, partial [Pirellulales bacterium]|nr:hypothetical protein [Pirellulales bacterium]
MAVLLARPSNYLPPSSPFFTLERARAGLHLVGENDSLTVFQTIEMLDAEGIGGLSDVDSKDEIEAFQDALRA